MKMRQFLLLGGVMLAAITSSHGTSTFAQLTSQDRIVGESGGNGLVTGYHLNNGNLTAGGDGLTTSDSNLRTNNNVVIGFRLPTLYLGDLINSATFRITVKDVTNTVSTDIALFGLDTTEPANGTALWSTSATGAIVASFASTSTAAANDVPEADVTTFIKSLYTGLTPNQDYVYFRLNHTDIFSVNNNDYGGVRFSNETAQLEISAIPEPSAALLGALGTLLMLRRRR